MTISTLKVASALVWFEENSPVPDTPVKTWRKARNEWLKSQGIGGVMVGNKKSKSIPSYWSKETEFWFVDNISEQNFINKWPDYQSS